MGFVFLESTHDPAFCRFSRAILLGLSCLVGTLLFVALDGPIHGAFTKLIAGTPAALGRPVNIKGCRLARIAHRIFAARRRRSFAGTSGFVKVEKSLVKY